MKLIGLILFIFILTKIDFQKIKEIIPAIQLSYLFMAVIFALLPVAVKAYRWKYLLKMQQINYSFKDSFVAYLSSIFAGMITPGKLGELIKVFYVKKAANISFGKAFSSVIIDRILDLFFLLLFSLTGIIYFYTYENYISVLVIIISIMALITTLMTYKKVRSRLIDIILKLTLKKYKAEFKNQTNAFLSGWDIVAQAQFIFPAILTLLAYLIYFLNCFLISKALDIPISFAYLSFCMSITVTLVLLPVSIGGIGIRDASLIILFSQIGISNEIALTYSFLFLIFINLVAGLLGVFAWMKMPLDFSEELKFNRRVR